MKEKVNIITLGCRVNENESRQMFNILQNAGYDVHEGFDVADIYIINSCAVTSMSEKKSRQLFSRAQSLNPNAKIIVCGCASQNNPEQFIKKGAYSVIGTAGKNHILDIIESARLEAYAQPVCYEPSAKATDTQSRQYIKVQDGCNNFCSYCLIPYLRGRSRSRDLADIIDEINSTSCKEVVLTGIDTSDYKIDGKPALDTLARAVDKTGKRFRFGSLEERIITDEFVKLLAECKNFAPNFHLSLQSGCDLTLKRMNRKYTTEQYAKAVDIIRAQFGNRASITTDVIVGFKGETDEEFDATYNFCQRIGFAFMHIFPYSPRKGTHADTLGGDVDGNVVKARLKRLEALNHANQHAFLTANVGATHTVLVEKIENGNAIGYTDNYLRATFPVANTNVDDLVKVRAVAVKGDQLVCEIENEGEKIMNCIFCKINKGEIPSKKVYEDELFFVIHDINPKAKIHLLAIPKVHTETLANTEHFDEIMHRIGEHHAEWGLADGYRVIINQGKNGGQEVPHLHIHLLGGEKLCQHNC